MNEMLHECKLQSTKNEDGEIDASYTDNEENRMRENPFRPSEMNELISPAQPVCIQDLDLNGTVLVYKDRTEEDNYPSIAH